MAVQEVPRQHGQALDHEHCSCVAELEQSNERLRAALERVNYLLDTNEAELRKTVNVDRVREALALGRPKRA